MATAPGRFWIVVHTSGNVIAKFDTAGETLIPDSVADYSDFSVVEVADRLTLATKTIDQSALTQDASTPQESV
jgi:hypothetical protein